MEYKECFEIMGKERNSYVSNDRTDYNTLIPVLEKHRAAFGAFPEETTADSGYCSEKNLLYLKENHANIQSEKGILNRQIRSIQTEGRFGDIKENEDFRRFHYRSSGKVYREFLVYTIDWNLNKYHRFSTGELKKYELKSSENVA